MSEAAIDLERERAASRAREMERMRPSRARMVRRHADEHGGIDAAAEALFRHLGEEEVARIAALAASSDPLDDGARRLSREEIEMVMTAKRLDREQRERLREFVARVREAEPDAKATEVHRRAQEELGIEVGAENFRITYWHDARRRAPKTNGRTKPAKRTPEKPKATRRAREKPAKRRERAAAPPMRKSVVPLDALIERLEQELRVIEERAVEIRAAIQTIRGLDGGAR